MCAARRHFRRCSGWAWSPLIVVWPAAAVRVTIVSRVASAFVWRVETSRPVVALTFDDGPAPDHTPKVLECWRAHGQGDVLPGRPAWAPSPRPSSRSAPGATRSATTRRRTAARCCSASRARGGAARRRKDAGPGGRGEAEALPAARHLAALLATGPAARHGYLTVLGSAYAFDPYKPPARYIEWVIGARPAPRRHRRATRRGRRPLATWPPCPRSSARRGRRGLQPVTLSELLAPRPAAR